MWELCGDSFFAVNCTSSPRNCFHRVRVLHVILQKDNNKPMCFVCVMELALLKTKELIGFVCFLDAIFQTTTETYWCCYCSDCLASEKKKTILVLLVFLQWGLRELTKP